ncbi:CarboxypepD_reg-like domain-containing protein [Saccharicrinis carchari]|uniref:CarboxypepD_reg-like domain-containing protein n=1 Tax=Saccharicrinis carchari TaxID=1168039 RepID=A0A521DIV4_SACCC|nr:carboxypeptidase-like regulatory domain-containing protein [Saccharicrinis carchari]SMO71548.1 CarboxypepD_reg-like domain-containing protein [Saccharicrinis carchari]
MIAPLKLILIIAIVFAHSCTYAQDKPGDKDEHVLDEKIELNYKSIKIEALLDSLHHLYNYDFSYDPSNLPVDSLVQAIYQRQSLYHILSELFRHYSLTFSSVRRQIMIAHHSPNAALLDYVSISGTVVSADNNQPIPFVNIAVKGQPLGTTSNTEGDFTFLVPRKYVGQQVILSSIAYRNDSVPIPQSDTAIIVSLQPQTIELKEIKVVLLSPYEIVKRIIENRERNYFTNPVLLTAFFRESIKQDGKYIEVSEAAIEIFKSSYLHTHDNEEARFIKGRKKVEDKKVAVARLKLAGGPALFSTVDVAKHLDFIGGQNAHNYTYTYQGQDIVNDRVVYKIGFTPVSELNGIYYEGELSVDMATFALLRAEFGMTKKTLRNSNKYLIRKNAKKVKSTPVYTRYIVDYRPYKDKWMLNSVRGDLIINMQDKRNKIKSVYEITSDMLITNARPSQGKRIRYSEAFKTKYVLADKIVDYDPDFWQNYNVIRPEEELENIFKQAAVEINVVPSTKKTKY